MPEDSTGSAAIFLGQYPTESMFTIWHARALTVRSEEALVSVLGHSPEATQMATSTTTASKLFHEAVHPVHDGREVVVDVPFCHLHSKDPAPSLENSSAFIIHMMPKLPCHNSSSSTISIIHHSFVPYAE